ncbi:MAG: hypothetical protein V4755_01200 [Curtobacterium sp.]
MLHDDVDLVLRNVRPWGGDQSDVLVTGGRIAAVVPTGSPAPAGAAVVDGYGHLALPGLVNAHAHVDKSWWGRPWESYGGAGGTQGRIAHERARHDAGADARRRGPRGRAPGYPRRPRSR